MLTGKHGGMTMARGGKTGFKISLWGSHCNAVGIAKGEQGTLAI
jgi:hypothetical protein